jgi:hypothetical protein
MFEFSIRGVPRDADEARRIRKPFNTTSDGRLYRPSVDVRVRLPGQARRFRWINLQVDAGADCCMLAQQVADDIGLERPVGAYTQHLRTAAGVVTAWMSDVEMHLGWPTEVHQFDWKASVGFVSDEALPAAFPSGILGIRGGLERFLSTVLVLSPDGPEAPIVRIYTP